MTDLRARRAVDATPAIGAVAKAASHGDDRRRGGIGWPPVALATILTHHVVLQGKFRRGLWVRDGGALFHAADACGILSGAVEPHLRVVHTWQRRRPN